MLFVFTVKIVNYAIYIAISVVHIIHAFTVTEKCHNLHEFEKKLAKSQASFKNVAVLQCLHQQAAKEVLRLQAKMKQNLLCHVC